MLHFYGLLKLFLLINAAATARLWTWGGRCSKCSGVVQILLINVVRALLRKLPVPLVSLVIPATFPCVSWSCVVTLWPLDIQCRGEGKGHVGQRSFFRAATPSRMILSAWWGQRFKGKIDLSSQGGWCVKVLRFYASPQAQLFDGRTKPIKSINHICPIGPSTSLSQSCRDPLLIFWD